MENEIIYTPIEETTKHQLAMLTLGTLAGFAAGKLTNVIYKSVVEAYRARHTAEEQ